MSEFTGKHLCQSLFHNKVEGFKLSTLFKKGTLDQVFSSEFYEVFEGELRSELHPCFYGIFLLILSRKSLEKSFG